ncbi:hypothetical protein KUD11_11145 [Roseovarius sp. LXJ103]|uniref:hypothetical protein n=1 Tax=Roseovarius carneus TaxID=2853164 RepID=UPI000D609FB5|nr:hypothetical protein [Roseovarius carneus]MBZ8119200.1 hypothetical protein [Roseovarius carneus]PWE35173.1 hypothetical protein DD563_03835 [Pelagicola sp. LXJ1103]
MGVAEELADQLAQEALKAEDLTGDERIVDDLANLMGATSQTAEEAFLTAVRVRRANIKARAMLLARIKAFKATQQTDT